MRWKERKALAVHSCNPPTSCLAVTCPQAPPLVALGNLHQHKLILRQPTLCLVPQRKVALTLQFTYVPKVVMFVTTVLDLPALFCLSCLLFKLHVVPNRSVGNWPLGVMERKGQASKIFNWSFNLKHQNYPFWNKSNNLFSLFVAETHKPADSVHLVCLSSSGKLKVLWLLAFWTIGFDFQIPENVLWIVTCAVLFSCIPCA